MANLTDNKAKPTTFTRVKAKEFIELTPNTDTPDESGRYFIYVSGTTPYFWNGSTSQSMIGGGSGTPGSLDNAYSLGRAVTLDEGAVVWTDATAGALNSMEFVKTGAGSGNIIDISVDAALTGYAVAIDMNLGIAANAIYIDAGATARTGSDILVNDDSTGNHSVIDINVSGSGNTVGYDFTGSYNGNGGGQALKVTLDANDNLTTEIMEVTTGAGARGAMFDLNFGHSDSGTDSHIFDIDVTGVIDSNIFDFATNALCTGNVFFVNLDTAVGMTALHIEGSGIRTQPMIELASDATGAVDFVSIVISGASSGNVVDFSIDTTFTGNVIDADMNLGVGSKFLYLDAGGGTRIADLIDIVFDGDGDANLMTVTATNTGSGALFDLSLDGIATGSVFAIDMNAAVGMALMSIDAGNAIRTVDLIDVTFDGSGNVGLLDVNVTNTGNANLVDFTVTGIHTGNVLAITYGTAASTGDAIVVAMGTNVAGSALNITSAGARTDDVIKIVDSSTGAGARSIFDIDVTGASTQSILDIATGNDCVASTPILITRGTGTNTAHSIDINDTGTTSGNQIDITFSGVATGNAIDLNMGTNVGGKAIDIASAGTADGCVLNVAHTGNLLDGSAAVKISSTGDWAAADGNLVELIQSTGDGTAGNYVLYISATGANVEGLKVDDGVVVFDESLTVGTTLEVTGATTLGSTLGVTGATTFTAGQQSAAVSRTATDAPGGTTGVIADGTSVVVVTCDNAAKVITLPTPTPGNIVWLLPNATGYELRSSDPATIAINGGTGANAESAVGANYLVRCVCASATTWIANTFSTDGTEAKLEAAA